MSALVTDFSAGTCQVDQRARDLCSLNSSGQRISVGARFRKVSDSSLIITLQVSYPHTGQTYIFRGAGNRFRNIPCETAEAVKRITRRSTLGAEAVEIAAHGKRVRCQKHGIGFHGVRQ